MFLTVVGCLKDKNAAFTNQSGRTDERSMSRDELAQSMPCKEEEDEVKVSLDKKIQAVNLIDGVFG